MLCNDIIRIIFNFTYVDQKLFKILFNFDKKLISKITINVDTYLEILENLESKLVCVPDIIYHYKDKVDVGNKMDKVFSFGDDAYIKMILMALDIKHIVISDFIENVVSKLNLDNFKMVCNKFRIFKMFDHHIKENKYVSQSICFHSMDESLTYGALLKKSICKKGNIDVINFLIDQKLFEYRNVYMNIAYRNVYMNIACKYGHFNVVKLLCDKFEIKITTGVCNPIYYACESGNLEIIKYLHQKYSLSTKQFFEKINSPFTQACGSGNIKLVKYLVKMYDITGLCAKDISLYMAFYKTCKHGNLNVLQYLHHTFNFSSEIKDNMFCTSLHKDLTMSPNCYDIIVFIHNNIGLSNDEATKIFYSACDRGRAETVNYLLGNFNITIQDMQAYNYLCLTDACYNGHLNIVKSICNHFDFTKKEIHGFLPYCLHRSTDYGHYDIVKYLCRKYIISKNDIWLPLS